MATSDSIEANHRYVKNVIQKSKNLSDWYTQVVLKAELADYFADLKGFHVIRPYGYSIWEKIQSILDKKIKATGHENAYFPLLIPEELLIKEADHIAGFSPKVAWVSHGGKKELKARLAIRPTSETIVCTLFSKWVQSWRDLPILINQWCNVIRWEKETRFFLRSKEFLWQEGHTLHCKEEEAEEETLRMLEIYRDFIENDLAISVIIGKKTDRGRFAGAIRTYTVETMMPNGRSLQLGTSHNLGQNFTKKEAFNITYLAKDGKERFPWQTSWGVSTRLIGGIVMLHGDDSGLILPPKIAPIQVIIIPHGRDKYSEVVIDTVHHIVQSLADNHGFRVKVDWRKKYRAGWKFCEWELKGVPIRIEIGPKEVEQKELLVVRRDTGEKIIVPISEIDDQINLILQKIQKNLLRRSKNFRISHTNRVKSLEQLTDVIDNQNGFIIAFWCGDSKCEDDIRERTGLTSRCISIEPSIEIGSCVCCNKTGNYELTLGKVY